MSFYSKPSGLAMDELIQNLKNMNVEINLLDAIELFGKDGTSHTFVYANIVKSIEIWEIDKKFETTLRKNFANAKIRIVDSIKFLQNQASVCKYSFIVIDNPMNIFGTENVDAYCEHFEIIKFESNNFKTI